MGTKHNKLKQSVINRIQKRAAKYYAVFEDKPRYTDAALGSKFGVSSSTISNAKRGLVVASLSPASLKELRGDLKHATHINKVLKAHAPHKVAKEVGVHYHTVRKYYNEYHNS